MIKLEDFKEGEFKEALYRPDYGDPVSGWVYRGLEGRTPALFFLSNSVALNGAKPSSNTAWLSKGMTYSWWLLRQGDDRRDDKLKNITIKMYQGGVSSPTPLPKFKIGDRVRNNGKEHRQHCGPTPHVPGSISTSSVKTDLQIVSTLYNEGVTWYEVEEKRGNIYGNWISEDGLELETVSFLITGTTSGTFAVGPGSGLRYGSDYEKPPIGGIVFGDSILSPKNYHQKPVTFSNKKKKRTLLVIK